VQNHKHTHEQFLQANYCLLVQVFVGGFSQLGSVYHRVSEHVCILDLNCCVFGYVYQCNPGSLEILISQVMHNVSSVIHLCHSAATAAAAAFCM